MKLDVLGVLGVRCVVVVLDLLLSCILGIFLFSCSVRFIPLCSIKKRQAVECAKRFFQGFSAPCANLACSKTQRIVNKLFTVTVLAGALDIMFGSAAALHLNVLLGW